MKLLKIALCIAFASIFLVSVAEAARPSYPWASSYPYSLTSSQARHHIIPWEELVSYGQATYTTDSTLTTFLNSVDSIDKVNMGEYTSVSELVTGYFNDESDAVETVRAIYAWLQGNLVIGPKTRTNDPGSNFDTPALNCRQYYFPNAAYNNLKQDWEGSSSDKKSAFELVAKTAMSKPDTATNHEPECKW